MNTIPFLYGELNKKVTPIEQSFIIRNTRNDFPKIGSDSKLYASLNPTALYIWNSSLGNYEIITGVDNSAAVTSVNNQTGDVHLTAQDVGALPIDTTIPSMTSQLVNNSGFLDLSTAEELFDYKNSATSIVSTHNVNTDAHSDIRLLIQNIADKLNNFLNVDDTTTDQLSEVLSLIDANKNVIEEITTNKVSVSSIVDNLTTPLADRPLSANQGVVLSQLIENLRNSIVSSLNNYTRIDSLLDRIYPVGSIYISFNETSPTDLFGGVWERIKDRFLLASGDVYRTLSTGGEASHTLTTYEIPAHRHSIGSSESEAGIDVGQWYAVGVSTQTSQEPVKYYMAPTQDEGGGLAHNNMPPYSAVCMWKRVG